MGFLDTFKKKVTESKDKYVAHLEQVAIDRPELVPKKKEPIPASKAVDIGRKFFTPLMETAKKAEPLVWSVRRGMDATKAVNKREQAEKALRIQKSLNKAGSFFIGSKGVDLKVKLNAIKSSEKYKTLFFFDSPYKKALYEKDTRIKDVDTSWHDRTDKNKNEMFNAFGERAKYSEQEEQWYQFDIAERRKVIKDTKEQFRKGYKPKKKNDIQVAIDGVKRGTNQVIGNMFSGMEAYGEKSSIKFLDKFGANMADEFKLFLASKPEWDVPEDMEAWGGDMTFYANLVGEGMPFIGGIMATAFLSKKLAVNQTLATFGFTKSVSGGATFDELSGLGISREEKAGAASLAGTVEGALELIPFMKYINRAPGGKIVSKKLINRIANKLITTGKQSLEEFGQEGIQTLFNNAIMMEYDENRGLWDGVLESAMAGAVMGGFTDISIGGIQSEGFQNAINKINISTKGATTAGAFFGMPGDVSKEEMQNLPEESKEAIKAILKSDIAEDKKKRDIEAVVNLARITRTVSPEGVTKIDEAHKLQTAIVEIETKEEAIKNFTKQDMQLFAVAKRLSEGQFASGDIETMLKSEKGIGGLPKQLRGRSVNQIINQATERYNEATGLDFSMDEALIEIQNIPTRAEIKGLEKQLGRLEENAARERGEITTQDDAVKFMQKQERAKRKAGVIESKKFEKDVIKKEKSELREGRKKTTQLRNQVKRKIKKIRNLDKLKRPKGKFTADIQNQLQKIRKFSELSNVSAQIKINRNIKKYGENMPDHIRLQNQLLLNFSNLKNADMTQLNDALNLIERLESEGIEGAFIREQGVNKKADSILSYISDSLFAQEKKEGKNVDDIIEQSKKGEYKTKTKDLFWGFTFTKSSRLLHGYNGAVLNFLADSGQEAVGDSKIARELGFTKEDGVMEQMQKEFGDRTIDAVKDILIGGKAISGIMSKFKITRYAAKQIAFAKKLKEDSKPIYKLSKDGNKYSKAEVRHFWALRKFGDDLKVLKKQFGNDIVAKMDKILEKEDKAFVEWKFEFYKEMHPIYNAVYRKVNGADIGFKEFYEPVKRRGYKVNEKEFSLVDSHRATMSKSSQYKTSKNEHYFARGNDLKILMNYIGDMTAYVAKAEKFELTQKVFKSDKFIAMMDAKMGTKYSEIYRGEIDEHLAFEAGQSNNKERIEALEWISNNYVAASLMLKVKGIYNQASSGILAAEHIPLHKMPKYLGISLKDLATGKSIKTFNEISNLFKNRGTAAQKSEFLSAMKSVTSDESLMTRILGSSAFKTTMGAPTLVNLAMFNIKFGDKAGVLIAGYADYMYQKDLLTKEHPDWSSDKIKNEALDLAEMHVSQTQQSARTADKSLAQKSGNSFSRTFLKYQSTPIQYQSKVNQYAKAVITGRGNRAKALKNFFLFHSVAPLLYNLIKNGFGFDDDDKKEYILAALLGNIGFVPILGDAIYNIGRVVSGLKPFEGANTILSKFSEDSINLVKALLKKGNLTKKDKYYLKRDIASFLEFFVPLNINTIMDMAYGARKVTAGEDNGAMLLQGWSRYTLGEIPKSSSVSYSKPSKSSSGRLDDYDF